MLKLMYENSIQFYLQRTAFADVSLGVNAARVKTEGGCSKKTMHRPHSPFG